MMERGKGAYQGTQGEPPGARAWAGTDWRSQSLGNGNQR